MKSLFLIIYIVLSIGSFNVFAKDITEAECVSILKSVLLSENIMKETSRIFPDLGKQKEDLLKDHYYWIGNNDSLLKKLAHDFNQTGLLKSDINLYPLEKRKRTLQITAQVMMESYYRIGLLKSSIEDLREFSKLALLSVKVMPYGHCKKYHFGPFDSKYYSQAISVQGKFYRFLTISQFRAYLAHYRRVIDNALDERKQKRELDPVTMDLATKAFVNALGRTFSHLPAEKRERLENALSYPETASDKDACEAGNLVLKALDSLDGQPFVLATTYILNEASK